MSSGKRQLVSISTRALVQRINRTLVEAGQQLRAARGARARVELGDYYMVDERGVAVDSHIDIEELGREIGALQSWEILAPKREV